MRRRLIEFAYAAEWALAKFYSSLFDDNSSELFDLVTICGRNEKNKEDAIKRLEQEIRDRDEALKSGKTWRFNNVKTEKKSAEELKRRLENNDLEYFQCSNGTPVIIPEGNFDAVVFTNNISHIDYIEALLDAGNNVLCEKPLVIVTDENHRADRRQLTRFSQRISENGHLIGMDAEHYSAKIATLTFYDRLPEMIQQYGKITGIRACTLEKDDPNKQRTRKLLSRKNRTGLLLDMGVHLYGVVSNIEGLIGKITSAEYGIYPGHEAYDSHDKCEPYDVETYVKTSFEATGTVFEGTIPIHFEFAKFIHRLKKDDEDETKPKEDKKQFCLDFERVTPSGIKEKTTVTIDFNQGRVYDNKGLEWAPKLRYFKNEYSNILRHFYESIIKRKQPRTSFEKSVQNLGAIYRTYEGYPVEEYLRDVYRRK